MRLIPTRSQDWLEQAVNESEGWPNDWFNLGILLGIFYVVAPVGFAVGLLLHLTGWIHNIPIWLSISLLVFPALFSWVALDEWRSRRRFEDGSGLGRTCQTVRRYWPQSTLNKAMVILVLVVHAAGAILVYLDRFTSDDLKSARWVRTPETIVVLTVDLWLIAVIVALIRWLGPTVSFWGTFKVAVIAVLIVNALISVGSEPYPWAVFAVLLAAVLALPGWLAHSIWRRRAGNSRTEPDAPDMLPPPWW